MKEPCHARYRGEQTPFRFSVRGRRVEVVDTWLAADHRHFQVTGDDGFAYPLRHGVGADRWQPACSQPPSGRIPQSDRGHRAARRP